MHPRIAHRTFQDWVWIPSRPLPQDLDARITVIYCTGPDMPGNRGVLGALDARQRGDMGRVSFGAALATASLVRRIEREATLTGHRGCVNTVRYSDTGRLLLTGSDDCRVGVYDADTFEFKQFLESGHEGNIFCAYSLPHTADARVVSCAADGRVQLIDVEKEEVRTLARHTGRAHNLAIDPSSPSVVMSGGEDGVVTLFDVRSRTPASTLFECPFPLNRIHLNPVDPNLMVVCGNHYTCRIYDRRRTSEARAVAPRLEEADRTAAHATCAVWNARGVCEGGCPNRGDAGLGAHTPVPGAGTHILASYHAAPIFLLDASCAVPADDLEGGADEPDPGRRSSAGIAATSTR